MITLFFLLASGDRLLRGFVEVLPRVQDKRTAVEIAGEIEENISGYLLTITIMNALVGVATGIAMKLCGLGDPILWGVMAFLLNYIPILGPIHAIGFHLPLLDFFDRMPHRFARRTGLEPHRNARDAGARMAIIGAATAGKG